MASVFELLKQIGLSKGNSNDKPMEYIIAGLGNTGAKYDNTRHNAGFMFIDYLENKCSFSANRSKFKSLCADVNIGGKRALIMKPQTFMNLSGEAVSEAANFYKIPAKNVIVISDDVNLDVGRLRVRKKGSDGGHNGLKNIIAHLGTDEFPRIRIGVGIKPNPDYDLVDWVLGTLSQDDIKKTQQTYDTIYKGLQKILEDDVDSAMQICNGFKA